MLEIDLEEGIQEILKRISGVEEGPAMIAYYGWPDSGKTYIIHRVSDCLESEGIAPYNPGGSPKPNDFRLIKEYSGIIRVAQFHCPWDRGKRRADHEDPDIFSQEILEREISLNVGIYNPKFHTKPLCNYDLIISNPNSVEKHLLPSSSNP